MSGVVTRRGPMVVFDDVVFEESPEARRRLLEWYDRVHARPHLCRWCRSGCYLYGRCEVCNEPLEYPRPELGDPPGFPMGRYHGIRSETLRPFVLAYRIEAPVVPLDTDAQENPLPLARALLLRRLLARPESP